LADGKVTLSGFSADAGHLVRVIDQSPLFSDATLDAAITPDVTEHKDRFSVSFRMRAGQLLLTLGRARKPIMITKLVNKWMPRHALFLAFNASALIFLALFVFAPILTHFGQQERGHLGKFRTTFAFPESCSKRQNSGAHGGW